MIRLRSARSVLLALFCLLPAQPLVAQSPHSHHHSFGDAQKWAKIFDDPEPGGRLAVIDFRIDSPDGPPTAARIAPDQVKAELQRAGYGLVEEHGFLPKQYFLVFHPRNS